MNTTLSRWMSNPWARFCAMMSPRNAFAGRPCIDRRPDAPGSACQTHSGQRSGIALILILGLIALFLLIAFAFSVKTRTDRWMARSSVSIHRTQHILVQALDQAMLEGTHYLTVDPSLFSYWYYPRREYINSSAVMPGNAASSFFGGFMETPMDWYIPSAVYSNVLADAAQMRWGIIAGTSGRSVTDWTNTCPGGCNNRIVAENFEPTGLAYYLVNCSGYLDINTAYDTTNRQYGTSVAEIQLDNLVSNSTVLANVRQNSGGHIDTMQELYTYCSNGVDLAAFFPFSHFVTGQRYATNNMNTVNAFALTNSSPAFLSTNETDITSAFADAGFNQNITAGSVTIPFTTVKGWLYTNLLDYMDQYDDPVGFEQPSQEHVPAMNEIRVRAIYSCRRQAASNYIFAMQVYVDTELWNAHLYMDATPPPTYLFECVGPSLNGAVFIPTSGFPTPFAGVTNANISYVTNCPARSFTTHSRRIANVTCAGVTNPTPYIQAVFNIQLRDMRIREDPGGPYVDKTLGATFTCTSTLANVASLLVGEAVTNSIANQIALDLETIDPRFNWCLTNSICFARMPTDSFGTTNAQVFSYMSNLANSADCVLPVTDDDTYMYCPNAPLTTVGDLGYLVFAPWRTVKLYSPDGISPYHRVVDTFTLKTPGLVEKGLVNPNTAHQKVLAAVFKDMPINRYPGDPATMTNLTWAQSLGVADRIIRFTYGITNPVPVNPAAIISPFGVRKGLMNISDTYRTSDLFTDTTFLNSIGATSEFTREALVRNSSGLLSTRQNLFTIFLAATDELNTGNIGNDFQVRSTSRSGAEQRAVALVWCDPWTRQAYPQYPEQFVRFFRLIPNDGALARY